MDLPREPEWYGVAGRNGGSFIQTDIGSFVCRKDIRLIRVILNALDRSTALVEGFRQVHAAH